MTWLAETPRAVVRAHLLMLPRLQAEESLREVQRIGVGTGSLKAETIRTLLSGWARTSDNSQSEPVKRSRARRLKAFAAAAGVGIRKVLKPS
jgi:ribose 5-phosphate isomerase